MGVGQSMETLLNVENLGVNYGSVQALHDATFRLGAGSICGLIGMNGSGKSTLFKAIMGVTPAHTGSVEIAGGDPAAARKSGVVSYVPQSEEIDWSFPVSVRDVVAMGRYRTLGPTRRLHSKDKQALAHALERLELTDLSGGQRKRAFVARAIAQGARLLLLDEPFAGVDKRSEAMLIDVLKQLRDSGASVLVSTHDLASLHSFADEAVLLRKTVLMHSTPEAVLAPENLVQAFGMHINTGHSPSTPEKNTANNTDEQVKRVNNK